MLSSACNSSLSSNCVMIFIFLFWNRLMMKSMARAGSLIRVSACLRGVMPMESKALLMSWNAIHSSLWLDLASSITLCKVWIGVFVVPPGKPPKFGPRKMLWNTQRAANLVLIMRTVSFLRHSSRIIGRVFSWQNSQSVGFGMGNICDIFHSEGMSDDAYNIPAKDLSNSCTEGCKRLINM